VQEFCLRAYYGRDKRGHLLEANLQLEVARHLVRLANAAISAKTLCFAAGTVGGDMRREVPFPRSAP
jgi:hypothetical protein